jgi:hypothetical protein
MFVTKWAAQNLVVAAVILRTSLETVTPEEKKIRQHLQTLLDVAAVQQAESSASQREDTRMQASEWSAHRGSLCLSGR